MNKRLSTTAGLAIWIIVTSAACGAEGGPTIGQSGSEGLPDPDVAPKVADVSGTSFRIVELGNQTCEDARDPSAQRVSPAAAELRAKLGGSSAQFVVLLKQEISLSEFPLPPGSRDDPTPTPAQSARAVEIAKSQVCAVKEVRDQGGSYVDSFLLINAFVAELTAETAIHLSQRADVSSVELSQTDTPPP